jgi:hypothetical protein
MNLFARVRWALIDCTTGTLFPIDRLPFQIGSGDAVDLKLNGGRVAEQHCALQTVKSVGVCLVKGEAEAGLIVNGQAPDVTPLETETDYSICIGNHLFALPGSKKIDSWPARLNVGEWWLLEPGSSNAEGPTPLLDLCRRAANEARDLHSTIYPSGLETGFYLGQAMETLRAYLDEDLSPEGIISPGSVPRERTPEPLLPVRGQF